MHITLIISVAEWQTIVSLMGVYSSSALEQLHKKMNLGDYEFETSQVIQSLQDKGLARQEAQGLLLEPLIHLLVKEAMTAETITELRQGTYTLKCPNMYMLFEPYEYAPSMWRIVPLQNMESILQYSNNN